MNNYSYSMFSADLYVILACLVALLCFRFLGLDGQRIALCDVALVFVFSRFLSNSGRCPRRCGTTRSLPGAHESLTSCVTLP